MEKVHTKLLSARVELYSAGKVMWTCKSVLIKCTFTSILKQAIYSTRWELAESIICGCKNCTRIVSGAIQKACQLSSIKELLEGAECISAIEDVSNAITREESKGVNDMNDTILGLAEVSLCHFCSTDKCLLHKRKKEVYTITKH